MMQRVCGLLCLLVLSASMFAQAPSDQRERMLAMRYASQFAMAVTMYGSEHATLPPDVRTLADLGILPAHGAADESGRAWLVDGVAYSYLGVDGVSPSEVPDWGDIAIAHLALDRAFATEPTPDNPDGALVPVAFLDGHVEIVSLAEARWLIADAQETFAALREGGPMPMHRQLEIDAARLAQAVLRHAAEHKGAAPPDWSSAFPYLEATARSPEETQTDRLRLFLAPKARSTTFIPEFEDVAERNAWIEANSMWRTDAVGANLWHVPNPMFTVLVYARPDAWAEAPDRRQRQHVRRHAFATVDGRGEMADLELIQPRVEHAQSLYAALRDGSPLPPIDDAMHDLRVLSLAIAAYARANDGLLPEELSQVVPYLGELWGVHAQQPARVFLVRGDENAQVVDALPDADWVARHCSYVYLGDPTVRLRDLRGLEGGILVHAPIDRPFEFAGMGEAGPRVPFAGPAFSAEASAVPMFMFPPEFIEEQARASRAAIEELAQN